MKSIILLLFLLLNSITFAQKFASDSSSWHTFHKWYGTSGPGGAYTSLNNVYTKILQDTVIGLDTFQIVSETQEVLTPTYSISEIKYFIKLDSNKLYAGTSIDELRILYDFNLNLGDTFIQKVGYGIYQNEYDTLTVIMVDTVEMGGKLRKRILFENFSSYITEYDNHLYNRKGMMWVEGIGDLIYGFVLNPQLRYNFISKWSFECFIENSLPIFGGCAPASINENPSSPLKVYPNPTSEKITIEWFESESTLFYLYDLNGKLILQTVLEIGYNIIPISHLHSGVYLGIVKTDSYIIKEKIILK